MDAQMLSVVGPYKVARGGEVIPVNQLLGLERQPRPVGSYVMDEHSTTPSGKLHLREYQRRAVTFLQEALRSYGLDGMGLTANGALYCAAPGQGKTSCSLQALHCTDLLQESGIVIGPLQAQKAWCAADSDPVESFGLRIQALDGERMRNLEPWANAKLSVGPPWWFFIHYEILDDNFAWISQIADMLRPTTLIVDESQYLGNPEANQTRAARALSGMPSIKYRILLTATPIGSGRLNLWSQLDVMQPGQWGTYHDFAVRYAGLQQERTQGGQIFWVPTGPTNTPELRSRLSGFVLKVSRNTAAAMGGTRIKRVPIWISPGEDERAEIQEAILAAGRTAAQSRAAKAPVRQRVRVGNMSFLAGDPPEVGHRYPEKLVALTHTISALAQIKVRHAAKAAIDMAARHKYSIVFTERRDSARRIAEELRGRLAAPANEDNVGILGLEILGPIDGAMPVQKRWAICDKVGEVDHAILVATAGSVGVSNHSLRIATACLMVTPFWNPDQNIQVEGRLLSEGDDVEEKEAAYLLIENNPVDLRILERIREKEQETDDILGLGPNEAVGRDLSLGGPEGAPEEQDAGALWDSISSELLAADAAAHVRHAAVVVSESDVPIAEPAEELSLPLSRGAAVGTSDSENDDARAWKPYIVPATMWEETGAPQGALDAIEAIGAQGDDTPVGLARHPDLGWAIIAIQDGHLSVVWRERKSQ